MRMMSHPHPLSPLLNRLLPLPHPHPPQKKSKRMIQIKELHPHPLLEFAEVPHPHPLAVKSLIIASKMDIVYGISYVRMLVCVSM